MTGARIEVDDAKILSALQRVVELGSDPGPILADFGEHMITVTKDRIRSARAPDGSAWAPLNPDYAAAKKGPGILRETGQLLREIVYQVDGATLMIGTNRQYADVHQFGMTIKPKTASALVFSLGGKTVHAKKVTIPARPFLGLSDDDKDYLLETAADHLAAIFDARR